MDSQSNSTPVPTVQTVGSGVTKAEAPKERYRLALREATKLERLAFTDAIQAFTDYVDPTGAKSTAPGKSYANFTRQVYAAFGLNKKQIDARMSNDVYGRNSFEAMELLFVQAAERAATQALTVGMERSLTRAEIKSAVKAAIAIVRSSFSQIADNKMFSSEAKV